MPTDFTKAFASIGLRPKKPLAAKSRQELLSQFGHKIPSEMEAFYETCNGGRVKSLGCRFYPLSEAVELVGFYKYEADFAFLPFFVSEDAGSDPCMIGVEQPLTGYVFQVCHDGPSRVLAPSVSSLLHSLASQPSDEDVWFLEDASLVYPKSLSSPEQTTVQRLLKRSLAKLEIESEPSFLIQLALSMLKDEACVQFCKDIDHPDHNARHEIAFRLERIGTPEAKGILQKQEDELKAFVKQAMKILKKHGFTATTEDGTDIHVLEGDIHLNVPALFDGRNEDGCWDDLVEYLSDRK